MAGISVDVTGIDGVLSKLVGAKLAIYKGASDIVQWGGQRTQELATENSPVITGHLRDSNYYHRESDFTCAVGNSASYSSFINGGFHHFGAGNRYIPPNPFFDNGLDQAKHEMKLRFQVLFGTGMF